MKLIAPTALAVMVSAFALTLLSEVGAQERKAPRVSGEIATQPTPRAPAPGEQAPQAWAFPDADLRNANPARDIPVYKPPKRGAPAGRVDGGSRSVTDPRRVLVALVPDHVALTVRERPVLLWYASSTMVGLIELTILNDRTGEIVSEQRMAGHTVAGIHRFHLADDRPGLSVDGRYRWSVALVVDSQRRSRDIVTGGFIERRPLDAAIASRLDHAAATELPSIYAEAGIWYDAVATVVEFLEAAPGDRHLATQLRALLSQVGLQEVFEAGRAP